MALTMSEARDWLRVDGTDNDAIIAGLLEVVPGYIEAATGLDGADQELYPICDTIARLMLSMLYDGGSAAEGAQLQRTIDALIKNLAAQVEGGGL